MTIQPSAGPIEALLQFNQEILVLQEQISRRRRERRILALLIVVPAIILPPDLIIAAVTWRSYDMGPLNSFILPTCFALLGVAGRYWYVKFELAPARPSIRQLELSLEIAEERRRLNAYNLRMPVPARQYTYRESIPQDIERLRKESQHYRRIHNAFQSMIITGSLGTTTAASLTDAPSPYKEITIGLSFLVGISAGFTGYFKYRERGFYLQQTADAIEEHLTAFELGITPYVESDEHRNLSRLAAEVEALRVEQRKREQQLDQPHQGRDQVV